MKVRKQNVENSKKEGCPYCERKTRHIDSHVSVKHPEKWNEYAKMTEFEQKSVNQVKAAMKRCGQCGALVQNLEKHIRKTHNVESPSLNKEKKSIDVNVLFKLLIEKGIITENEYLEKHKSFY